MIKVCGYPLKPHIWGSNPKAEIADSKSVQYRFESDVPYQLTKQSH